MKNLLLTLLFGVSGAVASHGAVYDITAYGAVADTTRLSTSAIQQAIDACNAAGGGEVLVPAGAWKTGSIFLKSNVTLRLENGATLYGSTDIRDYTPIKTDYVSLRTHTPTIQLIYADKARSVAITGQGTIDGRGAAFPKLTWEDRKSVV